ncbi:TPA: envelope stress sensor histidine kinase CpxA [Escherichia coli]
MIGSLTARIFAIFWLTLALVLMLVLMLPKLDSRQMTELLDSEQRQGLMIEQHVEAELANDPPNDLMWWRRLFRAIDKWAPPGQRLLLVTTEGRVIGAERSEMQIIRNFIGQADNADHPQKKKYGRVIGAERSEMQIIRNFIGQADNADHPQKKKYGRVELVGPFSVRDGEDNYQLYLIRPASSSQSDFINLLFDRPLLLLIVTMLVSTPLLLWLAWSLAKPARKLKNAADEVAQGNLRQHPELEAGPQEFLAAGASFNQMVTALERMMTSQQRLLSDISHELRTPLTRLQLGTALLRRRSGESKELERIETEAQRLDSMINDLLVMSRNQQKNALVSETIKANQLWSEVLDNAAFEAEQMGKSLTVNFPPGPWPLYGNPNALESALENIVRNALRYSHTKIEVGFAVDKDGITITVDDDGPGVSPEDREQIFRPFYRTDEARDRESGGTGLGLAIVETAIQQHRGWVKAEDSPLGGLRLVIWLPLYKRS